jgi:hypothetical protein
MVGNQKEKWIFDYKTSNWNEILGSMARFILLGFKRNTKRQIHLNIYNLNEKKQTEIKLYQPILRNNKNAFPKIQLN